MNKYLSLRLVAWFSRIFAWGQLLFGVLTLIYANEKVHSSGVRLSSFEQILIPFGYFIYLNIPLLIIFLALSYLTNVVIDNQENNRRSSFTETYQKLYQK